MGGKYTRNKGNSLLEIVDDYCIVDIETTDYTARYGEIIEIGVLKIRDNRVIDNYQCLVAIEGQIDEYTESLRGITNKMLRGAPRIDRALKKFLNFVGDDIIVGHNVNFDINFLYDNIKENFNLELKNDFIDTLRLSRKINEELSCHKLSYLAETFRFENLPGHRSMPDCNAVYELYNLIKDKIDVENIDLTKRKAHKRIYVKSNTKNMVPDDGTEFDDTNIFFDNVCVFTGTLERMERKEAMQHIVNIGGRCGDNITENTCYLIMGKQDYKKFTNGKESAKTKKAKKLIEKGNSLQIISENEFYEYLQE